MALCCTENPFPIIGTQVVVQPSRIEREGKEESPEHTQEQEESEKFSKPQHL